MDILDCCDICGEDHSTVVCPELGLNTAQLELDLLSTRARLTLPDLFNIVDNGNGLVGVIANTSIPAKTQFGPFEAKRTTHIFDDTGFFTLKLICKDGSTICLDTTDENECNWLCLVRAALSTQSQNCMAYQLGTNIFFSTTREISNGEELQVWYAPHFARKLHKPPEPDGETKVLLGHRIEPLVIDLGPDERQKYGQLSEDTWNEDDKIPDSEEPTLSKMEVIRAFYCPRCGHTFRTQSDMVQHLREHVLEATYKSLPTSGQKRGRGRPRSKPLIVSEDPPKRGRGRPRKDTASISNKEPAGKRRKVDEDADEFDLEALDDDIQENNDDSDTDAVIEDVDYSTLKDLGNSSRRVQPRRKRKGQNSWLSEDYVVSKIDLKKEDDANEGDNDVDNGNNNDADGVVGENEENITAPDHVEIKAPKKKSSVSVSSDGTPIKRGRGRPRKIKEIVENQTNNVENQTHNVENQTQNAENQTHNVDNQNQNVEHQILNLENQTSNIEDETQSINITNNNSNLKSSTINDINNSGKEEDCVTDTTEIKTAEESTLDNNLSVSAESISGEQELQVNGDIGNEEIINSKDEQTELSIESSTAAQSETTVDESLSDPVHVVIETRVEEPGAENESNEKAPEDHFETVNDGNLTKIIGIDENNVVNDVNGEKNYVNANVVNDGKGSDENETIEGIEHAETYGTQAMVVDNETIAMAVDNQTVAIVTVDNETVAIPYDNQTVAMATVDNETVAMATVDNDTVAMPTVDNEIVTMATVDNETIAMVVDNTAVVGEASLSNHSTDLVGNGNHSNIVNDHSKDVIGNGNHSNEVDAALNEAVAENEKEANVVVEEVNEASRQEVIKILEDTSAEAYACMLCDKKFQTESDAVSHFMNQSCRTDKSRSTNNVASSTEDLDNTKGKKGKKSKDRKVEFVCDLCHQAFSSAQYLYRHMVMHTNMFTCIKCKKTFSRKDSMHKHVLKCCPHLADNYKIYACKVCSRVFSTRSGHKKHMMKCSSAHCEKCEKVFNSQADMAKHKCEVTVDTSVVGKFACAMCPKTFQSLYYLKQHIQLHDKLYTCIQCGKSLKSEEEKVEHMMLCKTVREIKTLGTGYCDRCSESFTCLKSFREHYLAHSHPYQCTACQRRFIKIGTLSSHDCQLAEPGTHLCHICHRSFRSATNLSRHLQEQACSRYECSACKAQFNKKGQTETHQCSAIVDGTGKIVAKSDTKVICTKCGKTFMTRSNLHKHMQTHGDKLYQCHQCSKQFHLKVYLKEHVACVHYNIYQYQCNVCGKILKSKTGLIMHNKLKHTEQPAIYKCMRCPKVFKQKLNLRQHMISHSSERKYTCQVCLKTFKYPDQLSRHRFEHKDVKKLPCSNELCDKSFFRACELRKHEQIYHSGYVYVCAFCETRCTHRHTVIRHYKRKHPDKCDLLEQEGYVDRLYKHYSDIYQDDIITDGIVMQNHEDTNEKIITTTEALSHTAAQALHSLSQSNVTDPKTVIPPQEVEQMVQALMPNIPTVSINAGSLVAGSDNTITINNLQALEPTVEAMENPEGQIVILQIVDPEGFVPGEIIQQLQVGDFIQGIQDLTGQNVPLLNKADIITVTKNKNYDNEENDDDNDNDLEKQKLDNLNEGQGQIVTIQLPTATQGQTIEIPGSLGIQSLMKAEISESQTDNNVETDEESISEQGKEMDIQEVGGVDAHVRETMALPNIVKEELLENL